MGQFEDMALFIRIIDAGGICKAAQQLQIAQSAVSRRLRELEQRLGTQLLVRSTRSSQLTEAGMIYYTKAQDIVGEVAALNEHTSHNRATIEGTLKITAPLSFGLLHLSPVINAYAKQYSQLKFLVDFTDRHVDIIEEGFELAFRIGNLPDSSLQAQRITVIEHVLCASPEYLATFGTPTRPDDLRHHAFLQYGLLHDTKLHLDDAEGKRHSVPMRSNITANNGDFLKNMALHHHGIVCLPTFMTYQELASGQLVPLLPDYRLPRMHAHAVYPRNRFLPQRCRRFIEFVKEQFNAIPYWDSAIN